MYLVNRSRDNWVVSEMNYPKTNSFNPISICDLRKKNPQELIFTADAIDYLNNHLFLTIVNGEWEDINTEPF